MYSSGSCECCVVIFGNLVSLVVWLRRFSAVLGHSYCRELHICPVNVWSTAVNCGLFFAGQLASLEWRLGGATLLCLLLEWAAQGAAVRVALVWFPGRAQTGWLRMCGSTCVTLSWPEGSLGSHVLFLLEPGRLLVGGDYLTLVV